jgi:hypothetical protein
VWVLIFRIVQPKRYQVSGAQCTYHDVTCGFTMARFRRARTVAHGNVSCGPSVESYTKDGVRFSSDRSFYGLQEWLHAPFKTRIRGDVRPSFFSCGGKIIAITSTISIYKLLTPHRI